MGEGARTNPAGLSVALGVWRPCFRAVEAHGNTENGVGKVLVGPAGFEPATKRL